MKTTFLEKLLSPKGNALEYNITDNSLIDKLTGEKFEIINEAPILLQEHADERWIEVTLSNGVIAKFYYVDHYHKDAEVFDYFEGFHSRAAQHENRRLREFILTNIPFESKTILDVGCGSAWVAAHFAKNNPKTEIVSMDISIKNPVKALEKYPFDRHYGLVADVYALPFKENAFDCIIAAEVMEHTPDPKLFIINLLRVLKPNGVLIITAPYNEQIPHSLCVHCNRLTPHNAHLHTFNEKNINALMVERKVANWSVETFVNKLLVKLRMHSVLRYLPFKGWRILDKFANLLYNKPLRLLLKIEKT